MVAAVAAGSGVKKQPEKRMASPESVLSQSATPILLSQSATTRLEAGSGIFAECKYNGKRKPGEGSSESADKKERRKEGEKRKESKVGIGGKKGGERERNDGRGDIHEGASKKDTDSNEQDRQETRNLLRAIFGDKNEKEKEKSKRQGKRKEAQSERADEEEEMKRSGRPNQIGNQICSQQISELQIKPRRRQSSCIANKLLCNTLCLCSNTISSPMRLFQSAARSFRAAERAQKRIREAAKTPLPSIPSFIDASKRTMRDEAPAVYARLVLESCCDGQGGGGCHALAAAAAEGVRFHKDGDELSCSECDVVTPHFQIEHINLMCEALMAVSQLCLTSHIRFYAAKHVFDLSEQGVSLTHTHSLFSLSLSLSLSFSFSLSLSLSPSPSLFLSRCVRHVWTHPARLTY